MNKQDNKLAISVVATLTTGIALIYTLIMYNTYIFAVALVSILFLITAFILTQNIVVFVTMKNKSTNVHIKNCVDDISNQLEAMSGAQAQLGKATYLYTRQAAQKVATLENNYSESQEALYKNLASISNAQNKATKLMIKYDQNNTNKLISSIKDMRNTLSETMINGFDQIQPNNADVIAALESIVDYLKSQSNSGDQALGLQLNNVAHELQNISNSIQHAQVPVAGMVQTAPVMTATPMANSAMQMEMPEAVQTEAPAMEMPEAIPDMDIPEEMPAAEEIEIPEELSGAEMTEEFAEETVTEAVEEVAEETVTETIEETVEEAAPVIDKGANEMLDPDEIAALFAAADPAPKKAEPAVEEPVAEESIEEVAEETIEEEPFTPTFTVVGKSEETEETPSVPTLADLPDDPNKQLSPDEIAALFASADPAPKKEPVPEPVAAAPSEDPNKQLSPDEIAALFAAAEPTPKKDDGPSAEEKEMDAALANAAPAPVTDDPNKQLSPDEIAALFASMG